jgi:hypothetical protein
VKAFAELFAAESSSKDGPYFLGESISLVSYILAFMTPCERLNL